MQFKSIVNALILLLVFGTFACQKDDEAGAARVRVLLTDGPADYEAVNIDIQDVQINPEEGDQGWRSLEDVTTGVFNLLELTGGLDMVLADQELPAGRLSQLRLILGENNSLQVDGEMKDLSTPSAQQSGLKILINTDLEEGVTYDILLDFDAARSIVEAGNSGKFQLKPVIHASLEANSGGIKGSVTPMDVQTLITATDDAGETWTTYTDENGQFLLRSLPAGTYDLTLEPETASGLSEVVQEDIVVELGAVTDVGTVDLEN